MSAYQLTTRSLIVYMFDHADLRTMARHTPLSIDMHTPSHTSHTQYTQMHIFTLFNAQQPIVGLNNHGRSSVTQWVQIASKSGANCSIGLCWGARMRAVLILPRYSVALCPYVDTLLNSGYSYVAITMFIHSWLKR